MALQFSEYNYMVFKYNRSHIILIEVNLTPFFSFPQVDMQGALVDNFKEIVNKCPFESLCE